VLVAGFDSTGTPASSPHVLAREPLAPQHRIGLAVEQHLLVAERLAEAGVVRERARGAVDVELRVAAGGPAGLARDLDELVAVLVDRGGELLEDRGPRREREPAQRRPALLARVGERAAQVEAGRRDLGVLLAGGGVEQGGGRPGPGDPSALQVAPQRRHHPSASRGP
jgi:hypothetical protein